MRSSFTVTLSMAIVAVSARSLLAETPTGSAFSATTTRGIKAMPAPGSLADIVGPRFDRVHYSTRTDLAPRSLPGLKLTQAPEQAQLVSLQEVFQHEPSGATIRLEGFERLPVQTEAITTIKGQLEPVFLARYQYAPVEFHGQKAAITSVQGHEHFIFVVDDVLFRIDVRNGPADERGALANATAESLWRFLHNHRQPRDAFSPNEREKLRRSPQATSKTN